MTQSALLFSEEKDGLSINSINATGSIDMEQLNWTLPQSIQKSQL